MKNSAPFVVQLAEAYIPVQVYTTRWDPMKALMMGTIFPELYRSYQPHEMEVRRK